MLLNGLVFVVWRSSWLQSCDCGCSLCMKRMIVTQRGSLANVVSCFKESTKSFFFFSYYLNQIHNGWWLGCGMGMQQKTESARISERCGMHTSANAVGVMSLSSKVKTTALGCTRWMQILGRVNKRTIGREEVLLRLQSWVNHVLCG